MSDLKDKLARAWVDDCKARLPAGHEIHPMRRDAEAKPPFSVLTVMRMEQVDPGADTWLAEVRAVCVCDMADGGSLEQERRMGELQAAIEATVPARDPDIGVRLCGFTVDEVRQAKAENGGRKVYSDVLFITAGVSRL